MKRAQLSVVVLTVVFPLAVAAAPRFARTSPVAGQPVVADSATRLMWQGCAAGETGDDCGSGNSTSRTWQLALSYCEGLTWGGYDDWRLPDIKELHSIVDNRRAQPAIDTAAFPGLPSGGFWSSTTCAGYPSSARVVFFDFLGYVNDMAKDSSGSVLCVRSAP